jgi:protein-L-isoaspartate(D-aspartate) O-methyltransferase
MSAEPAERLVRGLRQHIADPRVLAAIRAVPRDRFVPPELRDEAWDDVALPLPCGQSISQPLVVARMCELLELRGDERILDVGTGSGYHAAVLAQLGRRVWSVEREPTLSAAAADALAAAGIEGVELRVGDGTLGLPDAAPFDAINVAAAAPAVPNALEQQLAAGGRLVMPVQRREQRLVRLRRTAGGTRREVLERVRFVPLLTD